MKKELRKTLLAKRDNETDKEIKSKAITMRLIDEPCYKNAKTLMLYASFGSEVMTDYLLKILIQDKKTIIFPKCNPETNQLIAIKIKSEKDLKTGHYGILEPIGEVFLKEKIDIVVIPAISFDKKGYRLGYGKGYYDRFLEDFKGLKVGFCYRDMIEDELPIEEHDIKADMVICESGVSK